VIASPHPHLFYQNNRLRLSYAASRAGATNGLLDHFAHPGLFALGQLFSLLPANIIALPLFVRPNERDANAADDYDRRILALLVFGPAIAVIGGSAVSGGGLITIWGYPLWLFLWAWIGSVSSRVDLACLTRLAGTWTTITVLYAASLVADYSVFRSPPRCFRASSWLRKSPPGFTLKKPALAYVVSAMWLHVACRKHRPLFRRSPARTLIDGNPRRAPWVDLHDLPAGGVAVWTVGDLHVLPDVYPPVARNAAVQPPFMIPMRRGNGQVTVGWGIIRPRTPNDDVVA
jgi:hypothetical protein